MYFIRRFFAILGNIIAQIFNLGIRLKYVVAAILIITGGAVAFTYSTMLNKAGGKADYEEAKRYITLKNICEEKFIDPVDRSSMADSSSAAIVSGLGDRWSYYMTPDEYQSYQLYSANEYADVGMTMIRYPEGGFQINTVTPGTPAFEAGLTSGMVITAIDGTSILNCDIDDVRSLIRSKMNVPFEVEADGKNIYTIDCTVNYTSAVSYRLEKTEAGYIQIKNFEAGCGDDTIRAIEDLLANKAVALCIDVRNNSGGVIGEVTKILDYLLPNGELFSITDKQGHKDSVRSDAMSLQLPMVVLVNSGTYAEAELFAAILQEYGWAVLMGEATPGMTRMQETFEMDDGGAIRLSTKAYLTPKGTDLSVQGGVIPDMIIHNDDPSTVGTTAGTTEGAEGTASTSDDTQLMQALKYLS